MSMWEKEEHELSWVHEVKELLDEEYPNASKIRLVMDNLNTHSIASLYQAFDPETARRLAKRLEIHYTPKHGSWLNIAEIELSAMTRQCLGRRIPSINQLSLELLEWESARNKNQKSVDWQFTTDDARIKLRRLYPQFKSWQCTSVFDGHRGRALPLRMAVVSGPDRGGH